ncbi:MAG: tetratricopeptide repeat protein [Polyangiaceae bacterium]|nr:tetratricopeptide repeat protein [Polyangiaceae bacterium]
MSRGRSAEKRHLRTNTWVIVGLCFALLSQSEVSHAQFNPAGRKRPSRSSTKASQSAPRKVPRTQSSSNSRPQLKSQEKDQRLRERYQRLIFAHPGEELPLQRLIELSQRLDGSLRPLQKWLEKESKKEPKNRYPVLLAQAEIASTQGEKEKQRARLDEATRLAPQRAEAWKRLASFYRGEEDYKKAIAANQKTLDLIQGTEKDQVLRLLRDDSLTLGDHAAAKDFQRQLETRVPGAFSVAAELGREFLRRNLGEEARSEFERLVQRYSPPSSAGIQARSLLAQAYLSLGKPKKSLEVLDEALKNASRHPGLQRELIQLSIRVHREENRLPELIRTLETKAQTTYDWQVLAQLQEEEGQFKEALASYRKALQRAPRDIDLRLSYVRLLELHGEVEEAVNQYVKLHQLAPKDVALGILAIEALFHSGQERKALQIFDKLAAQSNSPPDTFALLELAERRGENQRVTQLAERLRRAPHTDWQAFLELGNRAFRDGDKKTAKELWKKALALHPQKARGLISYGQTLLDHHFTEEGLEALEGAVQLAPESWSAQRAYALGLERASAVAKASSARKLQLKALVAWDQALSLSHGRQSQQHEAEAHRHIVRLWSRLDRLEKELSQIRRLSESTPDDRQRIRLVARAEIAAGQAERAAERLRRSLQRVPGDRSSLILLKEAELKSTGNATATLEELVRVDPTHARQYLEEIAHWAEKNGDPQLARVTAERAFNLFPQDAEAAETLAKILANQGEFLQAISTYERALQLNRGQAHLFIAQATLLEKVGQNDRAFALYLQVLRTSNNQSLINQSLTQARLLARLQKNYRALEDVLRPKVIKERSDPRLRIELFQVLEREIATLPEAQTPGSSRREIDRLIARNRAPLLRALASGNALEAELALGLLMTGDDRATHRALLQFAQGQANLSLRKRALSHLRPIEDPDTVARLASEFIGPTQKSSPELEPIAVWALGHYFLKTAGPWGKEESNRLLDALDSKNEQPATMAALGWGQRLQGQKIGSGLPVEFMPRLESRLVKRAKNYQNSRQLQAAFFLALSQLPRVNEIDLENFKRLQATDTPSEELAFFRLRLAHVRHSAQKKLELEEEITSSFTTSSKFAHQGTLFLLAQERGLVAAQNLLPENLDEDFKLSSWLSSLLAQELVLPHRLQLLQLTSSAYQKAISRQLRSTTDQLSQGLSLLSSQDGAPRLLPYLQRQEFEALPAQKEAEISQLRREILAAIQEEILEAAQHQNLKVRAQALGLLIAEEDSEQERILLAHLDHSFEQLSTAALRSLRLNCTAALFQEALRMALDATRSWNLRLRAIRALGEAEDHQNERQRLAFVDALQQLSGHPQLLVAETAKQLLSTRE